MANKSISGDVNVEFSEAQSRQSLESGESVKTLFGKLRKWLTDLGTAAFTNSTDYAPSSHNQPSSTITSMTGYSKPQSTSAIAATDTLNEAIGKLEKAMDGAGTPNDGVLTIQQNGTTLGTFSANQSSNETINIQAISSTMTSSAVKASDGTATVEEGEINVSITDNISYSNLATGVTYTLKTRVYDVTTGDYLSITKDGVTSTEISTTITPTTNNGVYINTFSIDSIVGISVGSTLAVDEVFEEAYISSVSFLSVIEMVMIELGLRADFVNKTFTRLGDAVGLSGGSDFDDFPMYQRRRCNLSDDGTVNAYLGDANYAVDGSNGQVMVEQPKFYYKVVPVTLNEDDNTQLDVAEYWICDKSIPGYKLHPAFIDTSGNETNCFYDGAYEGYIQSNKLYSKSDVTPTGADTTSFTTFTSAAKARGTGWKEETIQCLSADQLLMIIEYGAFEMQKRIGKGNITGSTVLQTGRLNACGNGTYGITSNISDTSPVQWRGKENPWGNKYTWISGIYAKYKDPYVSSTKLQFELREGSISRFGYDADFDWVFLPRQGLGNTYSPVGDSFITGVTSSKTYYLASGGDCTALSGSSGMSFGPFYGRCLEAGGLSNSDILLGGRLCYIG